MRKAALYVVGAIAIAGLAAAIREPYLPPARAPAAALAPATPPVSSAEAADPLDDSHDDERSYVFRLPSGDPTALTCEEARTIVSQVRAGLAYAPESIPVGPFTTSTSDWLDPHGLLTIAKDSPAPDALAEASAALVAELEGRRQRGCEAALGPGAALASWTDELREAFDRGRREGTTDPSAAATEPLPPTGLAREVAFEIGARVGAFERAVGPTATPFAEEARRRFFPSLDQAGWSRVVLASAVRAYVPLVDPHGEWAPFDEESRIYEIDLASRPPARLWARAVPTAVGVRIAESATAPLEVDDIVLSVARVATAGLPLEQVDQLGYAAGDARTPASAVVLRDGRLVTVELGKHEEPEPTARGPEPLPSERVAYGDGDVLLVEVHDVRDDLGDELAELLATERERTGRKLVGLVLDLRGNGGGSTDGAIGALSLMVPGAPLFAMKRRSGAVEIDRATVPRERDRWTGPVATFVDATTASAAEMIAGALATYRRGPSIGTTTFGKGCAQEYADDDAHAGVLRMTTLVYALPDGSPVQRVGLTPQLRFPFTPRGESTPGEREAKLTRSAPPWRGPDLRPEGRARAFETPWPTHAGNVGPCRDPEACRALRLLGVPRRPAIAKN